MRGGDNMKQSIMLGNGVNRCMFSNISWGDLLDDIAKDYKNVKLNKNISFPMQFENLINQILDNEDDPSDDLYNEIKRRIIERLKEAEAELPEEKLTLHKSFAQSADAIITTNYDFLIEKSLDEVILFPKGSKNNKYNINNFVKVAGKNVYHIHGDLQHVNSICLGYEHYAGTLQHLRGELAKKKKEYGDKPAIIWALEKQENVLNTWAEKFFTDNIDIVGLGLTQSEIDIWWLITYRAFLYYSNRFGARDLIQNTIRYHEISTKPDKDMEYALSKCHVEYRFHEIKKIEDSDYFEAYNKIAEELKKAADSAG